MWMKDAVFIAPFISFKLGYNIYFPSTHHVDEVVVHLNPGTQQEGEEQLVFLKQRATHVAVQAEREEVVDVLHTLLQVVCNGTSQWSVNLLFLGHYAILVHLLVPVIS